MRRLADNDSGFQSILRRCSQTKRIRSRNVQTDRPFSHDITVCADSLALGILDEITVSSIDLSPVMTNTLRNDNSSNRGKRPRNDTNDTGEANESTKDNHHMATEASWSNRSRPRRRCDLRSGRWTLCRWRKRRQRMGWPVEVHRHACHNNCSCSSIGAGQQHKRLGLIRSKKLMQQRPGRR
jgi:hypothetical protein